MSAEQQLKIAGPAGSLEALWYPEPDPAAAMVLCHPHPQMGGSMYDGVLDLLQAAARSERVSCLRFNFRGAGYSEGRHDGQAEWQDVLAAYDSLPRSEPRMVAGYSFGGAMAVRAASELEQLQGLVLVAPALAMLDQVTWPECPVLIMVGDQDPWISVEQLQDKVEGRADIQVVSGADHFFQTGGREVTRLTADFIGAEKSRWS